jgi:hypothetical protein
MSRPASARPGQPGSPAPRLTARGALVGMAVVFTLGLLMASWLGWAALAGACFVIGCGLAAWYTIAAELLAVVLAPPLLFLITLLFVQVVAAPGSLMYSVVIGSVITVTSLAPWLLAGMLLSVVIALPRGLPRCVADFGRDLRALRGGSLRSGAPQKAAARQTR